MKDLVTKFRAALDLVDWSKMPEGMQEFPKHCCHRASELLARYLHSQGFSDIEYIHALYPGGTHCWLEINGFAVDITADQFPDIDNPFLVQPPHLWHSKFGCALRREPKYNRFPEPEKSNLNMVYEAAMEIVNA